MDVELIADHFTASVSGIVYHWMSDPDNLDEMRSLHNGLKQVWLPCWLFSQIASNPQLKGDKIPYIATKEPICRKHTLHAQHSQTNS